MPLGEGLEYGGGGFLFSEPFWGGTFTSNGDTPGRYPVSLFGVGFVLDVLKTKLATMPAQRQSIDQSQEPGEGSLNAEGLWTRQQSDWSLGEGQVFFDRIGVSDRKRVHLLRGGEWTSQDALTVGNRFERQESQTGAGQLFLKTGTWWYWYNGTTFSMTQTPTSAFSSWTALTGLAGTPQCITSDGTKVYIGTTTNLYSSNIGTAAQTASGVGAGVDHIGYVQNHLLVGQANALGEVAAGLASVTNVTTHFSTSFRWSIISGGNGFIYAGGFIAGISELFVITVNQTTGALLKSIAAATFLPDEQILSLVVYGQKAVIGTTLGVRVGDIVTMGGINYGPPTGTGACAALYGYGRFVYFGATNVSDGISTSTSGLGRIDLSTAVDATANEFAYSVDALPMVAGGQSANQVLDVAVASNGDVFGIVDAKGIYRQIANGTAGQFASGQAVLESGWLAFNTIEKKTEVDIDLGMSLPDSHDSITIELSVDGTTWTLVATASPNVQGPFSFNTNQARRFKLRISINAGSGRSSSTAFPYISYWTVRAIPAPRRSIQQVLALMIANGVDSGTGEGQPSCYTPQAAFDLLFTYVNQATLGIYQQGTKSYVCQITDLQSEPVEWADQFQGFNGLLYATITIPNP
jgi:hypothetical protein